ncbi:MFS transporter [Kribbella sandramycini]|uniref:MFS transporter n=1 Tax=Kribbella sandramycini TaxID=60450 RepID=A0A7Y4P252_9ACTN|nr:MFS transporter [Kribbella sandramycini]
MFVLSVLHRRRVLFAALVSTAVFPLAITGSTAVVPEVTAELPGADALGPWIVLGYNGLFAAALLLAGLVADRMSRTTFFALGNIVVAATGIWSAFAPDLGSLVALRTAAGVGAAMCAAGGSSMVLAVYPPEERRRVYGYTGAVLGSSLALGPIAAQALMALGGWELVFVVPAGIAALAVVGTIGLPSLRTRQTAPFDLAGALLFGVVIAATVIAFGFALPVWTNAALLAGAVAAAIVLVRVERRAAEPAIPFDLLRIPSYRAYSLATGAFMGMLVVGLAVLPQLSAEHDLGAGGAGLLLSLLTIPSTLLPLVASRIARRWARQLVTIALLACVLAAIALQTSDSVPLLFVAAAVLGVSLGLTEGVPDGQALQHVPYQRGGAGAALFSTTRMTVETLTLAAAIGTITLVDATTGLIAPAAVCLLAAGVLARGR